MRRRQSHKREGDPSSCLRADARLSRPASGLEPEIQKLISKHKQELNKLQTLHEAELLQADQRASQHYDSKCEELRQQLEREREELCHRERELAKQRCVWLYYPHKSEGRGQMGLLTQ